MAQLQWSRPVPAAVAEAPPLAKRLADRFLDWEDWLTLGLAAGAVIGVALPLEESGWSRQVPSLTQVGLLALLAALLLARSPLRMYVAWPVAAVAGAAATFWQTLELVGPGDLGQRIDAIYFRFQRWFDLAFSNQISNDPLPFNVMVVGLTWAGVFLFGWALFRWHDAWLGLVPGGIALFLNMTFLEDSTPLDTLPFVGFGFLLIMRANLTAQISRWRAQGMDYPPLISLTFLHFTSWMGLVLMLGAWIAPVGPYPTPAVVDVLVDRFDGLAVHFVRLAGPLHVKKIVPVHDYTAVLPFQGSIDLRERELLTVRLSDTSIQGPMLLRGAVYEEYASGGWKAGRRTEAQLPRDVQPMVREWLKNGVVEGRLIPLTIEVEARSVVGTVLFSPGQPVGAGGGALMDVPSASVRSVPVSVPGGGIGMSDAKVVEAAGLSEKIVVGVERVAGGRVRSVQVIERSGTQLPDAVVLKPREPLAKGESYRVVGLLREAAPGELRRAGRRYPSWVMGQYLKLPNSLPDRVSSLAQQVAGEERTAYDRAKAIESYLRQFPVDYGLGETPPGEDTVDYFLFEAKRGYFDYHASAMVVMLRAVGVPARLAVGFVAEPDEQGIHTVRDKDAYAWAEVYFPGYGWVEFNPSPDRPAVLRPSERARDDAPTTPSLDDFPDLPVGTGGLLPIGPTDEAPAGPRARSSGGPGYTPWIALAVAAFLAAVAGSAALGWRRSAAGLPYPQQLWEKTVRLASWAGMPPQQGQTPTEFARGLERSFRDVPDIELLAQSYNRSRFGHREPDEGERERLRGLWPRLRGALLGALLNRRWRRRG